jgi:tRNA nucleotidyltransferase/poly(A) polymerase
MTDLTPRQPQRPLFWPDIVMNLQDLLTDVAMPIYIVGGAVRDAYLHRPIKDLDLVTVQDSIKLARLIANRMHGDIFVLDDERDVARALLDTPEGRLTVDVSRFRGEDLLSDLLDRDFTINAMAVNIHGNLAQLIDPLKGQEDATNKILRRCTPEAIARDPIRAFRAVRQSVQLEMRIEPETVADIRSYGTRITETSPERVRDEFVNLLNLVKPAVALRVAHTLGLLKLVVPEVESLDDAKWQIVLGTVEALTNIIVAISPARTDHTAATFGLGMLVMQLDRYRSQLQNHIEKQWANGRSHRTVLNLAAILHTSRSSQKEVEARADALRLSKPEKTRLVAICRRERLLFDALPDERLMYRFWHQLQEAGVDVVLLGLAEYLAISQTALNQDAWLIVVEQARLLLDAYFARYEASVAQPPLIDGNQLMQALGLNPGPTVGRLLDLIREEQAIGNLHTLEEALHFARTQLNGQG